MDKCKDCKWWLNTDFIPAEMSVNFANRYRYKKRQPGEGKAWGECHKTTPQLLGQATKRHDCSKLLGGNLERFAVWAITHKFDFCGEFKGSKE